MHALVIIGSLLGLLAASYFTRRWFILGRVEMLCKLSTILYVYNKKDGCWDPRGSVDEDFLAHTMHKIAAGDLVPKSIRRESHGRFVQYLRESRNK